MNKQIFYVYVLYSKKLNKFYIGYSNNLKLRLEQHKKGLINTTRKMPNLKLIYYEVCSSQADSIKREKQLKTGYDRQYLRNRLKNTIKGV